MKAIYIDLLRKSCLPLALLQINFSVKAVPLGMQKPPVSVLCVLVQQVFQERSVNQTTMKDTMATQGLSSKSYNAEINIILQDLTRFLFFGTKVSFLCY